MRGRKAGASRVTQFTAGTAKNVIPDAARLAGTARTLTEAARKHVKAAIERRCRAAADAGRCTLDFDWHDGYPPTTNDPAMTDHVRAVAHLTLGEGKYLPAARATMGGEDFAYYLQHVPGCFFLIGLLPDGETTYPALHTDRFDFNDDALATGMAMMCDLVRKFDVAKLPVK